MDNLAQHHDVRASVFYLGLVCSVSSPASRLNVEAPFCNLNSLPATLGRLSLALPVDLSLRLPVDEVAISGFVDQKRVALLRPAEPRFLKTFYEIDQTGLNCLLRWCLYTCLVTFNNMS